MSTLAEDIEFGHNLLSVLPSGIFCKIIDSLYVESERLFFFDFYQRRGAGWQRNNQSGQRIGLALVR